MAIENDNNIESTCPEQSNKIKTTHKSTCTVDINHDDASQSTTATITIDNDDSNQLILLAIEAANGPVNWDLVVKSQRGFSSICRTNDDDESKDDSHKQAPVGVEVDDNNNNNVIPSSFCSPWTIKSLNLPNFGSIMKEESFQSAIDNSYELLQRALDTYKPSGLIVSSKGIGIIAYLAIQGLWRRNGPVLMLSPIPNPIDGYVHDADGTWESEWKSTIQILLEYNVGPIQIVAGSSTDERLLIKDAIEETNLCGKVISDGTFDGQPGWFYEEVEGGHSWKSSPNHVTTIAQFIDKLMTISHSNNSPSEHAMGR